jgi:thioredoxin 1
MLPELTTLNAIAEALETAKESNKLLLLKFGAQWCKPCKQIAPIAERLVKANANEVDGFEVDVDVVVESLVQFNVSKLPTFILIHQGNVVKVWSGSDNQQLENNLYEQIDVLRK